MQGWVDLCYVKAIGWELNPRPINRKSNALPLSHHVGCMLLLYSIDSVTEHWIKLDVLTSLTLNSTSDSQSSTCALVVMPGIIVLNVSAQVLVMAPTRELAKQVSETFQMFAAVELSVLSVYGGTAIYPQGELSLASITATTRKEKWKEEFI